MTIELKLGCTQSGSQVTLRNPENPHISLMGRSGCGKSFLLKQLMLQVVKQGGLCVVLDYSGDFQEYALPTDIPAERFDVTSSAFTLNPLIGGSTDQSVDVRSQQLLAAMRSVFRLGPRASTALRNVAREYLTLESMPSTKGLLEFVAGKGKIGVGLAAALEPLELLDSLVHSGSTAISLNLTRPGLIILNFNRIVDQGLQKFIVELVLQSVWNQHTTEPLSYEPPLVLVMDEAQNLAWGQNSMAIRILREGRKYDLAGWFASQWISNKEATAALGQAALQAHFRPDDQNVRQLARRLCPAGGSDLVRYQKLIQSLQRGQFVYQDSSGKVVKVLVSV